MADFDPFANDDQNWSVGEGDGLTIQNGTQSIAIFGEAKFGPSELDRASASELLGRLKAISARLGDGPSDRSLWTKISRGALTIGGSFDAAKEQGSRAGLSKAIDALEKYARGAKPRP